MKKKFPGFVVNVVCRNETLQFLPSYERLQDIIFLAYDIIKEIPLNLKRIEHHLYKDCHTKILLEVRTNTYLDDTSTLQKYFLYMFLINEILFYLS